MAIRDLRQTHTYAVLEISPEAYAEIRAKLEAAGYQHAFNGDEIDMHGIGVRAEAQPEPPPPPPKPESVQGKWGRRYESEPFSVEPDDSRPAERCACGHTKADHLDEAGACDASMYCDCSRYVPAAFEGQVPEGDPC